MIALYCRLSIADGDEGESDSIVNQRMMLADFVASRDDLADEEHRFFVDDGISGTHAENRPALQEMLRCCREGRVSTVIVKDFSRLSRDNLYCVRLVEDELPSLGVRVIAVSDNYDSMRDHMNPSAGTQLGFKAIMNSWYSKDLSRKVTQSIRSEHARGMNTGTVPFGYRKAKGSYTCEVEEEGAAVVRRIFELACSGLDQRQIARALNEEGAITPYNLKAKLHEGSKWEPKPHSRWTGVMVKRIVKNPHYRGTLVLGKTKRIEIGLSTQRATELQERRVFESAHEAIVSAEEWERAQGSMTDSNAGGAMEPTGHLFQGLVFCPHCGQSASYRAKGEPSGRYVAYCACDASHPSIALADLTASVASVVRAHIELVLGLSGIIEAARATPGKVVGLKLSLKRLSVRKMRAYEAYRAGEKSAAQFVAAKAAMDAEEAEVRERIEAMEQAMARREAALIDAERALELARRFDGRELSREAVEAFVERVELFGDDDVSITLRYSDIFDGLR